MNEELRIKEKEWQRISIIHHSLFLIRKSEGFTLIELLWSIAITATLSAVGIAAFFSFGRAQVLNNAALEFATTLQIAKSRAQSQAEPNRGVCTGVFEGYTVTINKASREYQLDAQYSTASPIKCVSTILDQKRNPIRKLPTGVDFGIAVVDSSFFFPVLSGGVTVSPSGANTVTMTGFAGSIKRISVSPSGSVSVN